VTCDGSVQPLQRYVDFQTTDIFIAVVRAAGLQRWGMNCFDTVGTSMRTTVPPKYPDGGSLAYQVAEPEDIPNYWMLATRSCFQTTSSRACTAQLSQSSFHHRGDLWRRPRSAVDFIWRRRSHTASHDRPVCIADGLPRRGMPGLEPEDVVPIDAGMIWGCDSDPRGAWTCSMRKAKSIRSTRASISHLGDELTAAGVSWKMYAPTADQYPGGSGTCGRSTTHSHIRDTQAWAEHIVPSISLPSMPNLAICRLCRGSNLHRSH